MPPMNVFNIRRKTLMKIPGVEKGCFLVEFMPEENGENYEHLYQMKKWRKKQDLNIMQKSPGKRKFRCQYGKKI